MSQARSKAAAAEVLVRAVEAERGAEVLARRRRLALAKQDAPEQGLGVAQVAGLPAEAELEMRLARLAQRHRGLLQPQIALGERQARDALAGGVRFLGAQAEGAAQHAGGGGEIAQAAQRPAQAEERVAQVGIARHALQRRWPCS